MVNAQSLRRQRFPIDHPYKSDYRVASRKEVLANTTVIRIMLIGSVLSIFEVSTSRGGVYEVKRIMNLIVS